MRACRLGSCERSVTSALQLERHGGGWKFDLGFIAAEIGLWPAGASPLHEQRWEFCRRPTHRGRTIAKREIEGVARSHVIHIKLIPTFDVENLHLIRRPAAQNYRHVQCEHGLPPASSFPQLTCRGGRAVLRPTPLPAFLSKQRLESNQYDSKPRDGSFLIHDAGLPSDRCASRGALEGNTLWRKPQRAAAPRTQMSTDLWAARRKACWPKIA